ncbi:AEC family transporter [Tannockella kyphosi]|uniref:AEC family transporter n=1 Tax=Tannockella kyphosi TaxID=2899121 RepID=UPI002013A6E2|nr:AEC family transporter [Tannockella kyphosi]
MKDVLVQSLGFILVILAGVVLKKLKMVKKEDGYTLAAIIMNVTLPCALFTSATGISFDATMLVVLCLGLIFNLVLLLSAYLVSIKKEPTDKANYMLCCSGYNIGNFIIPFCEAFFPGVGVAYICMFDVGNAIMVLGGSFALASAVATQKTKFHLKDLTDKLKASPPFLTYMVIVVMAIFELSLPEEVMTICSYVGDANGFLVMLMIGVLLELKISKEEIGDVIRILVTRYGVNTLLALLIYFVIPLPILAKQVLVLTVYSPLSTIAPVFILQCGYKKDVPAMTNSISIIISIIICITLLILFV